MPRELKNLPAVLKNAAAWGMTPTELEAQVERITVKCAWAQPRPAPRPISFLSWLKQDPKRCPPLWFALAEHSDRYLSDPKFEYMNFRQRPRRLRARVPPCVAAIPREPAATRNHAGELKGQIKKEKRR
jgi:hypothetical protein